MFENPFARPVSRAFINHMIGIIGGLFGGISGSLFIWLLNYAQTLREAHHWLIFTLPLAGLTIALLSGIPKLIIGSFLTHVGGGSMGREGAVLHFCKTLAENTAHRFKFTDRQTQRLIIVSIGAGFGAALGAPWTGILFGFEYQKSTFFRPKTMISAGLAAVVSQALIGFSGVPHFHFPSFNIPEYALKNLAFVFIAGILFGFSALIFHLLRKKFELTLSKANPMVRGLFAGSFIALLYYLFGLEDYQGLGTKTISLAAIEVLPPIIAIKKIILTTFTLGAGFQGGEFFPLAFIGSTIGSAFSFVDPSLTPLLAALGFVSVYGAATQTPIACTLLACELYGWKVLPFAAITLFISSKIRSRKN